MKSNAAKAGGDFSTTNDLVVNHTTLVKRIAYHLMSRLPASVQADDLIQAGMIGLIEASRKFDPEQGASFETYAGIRIRGAMLDEIRRTDWTPRSVHRKAREVAEYRHGRDRDVKLAQQQAAKLEDVFTQMGELGTIRLQLLIKADVHGSSEALKDALQAISNEEVNVTVVSSGVGGITESDISLAVASGAVVTGFNVRANSQARDAAEQNGIEIRYYSIIYDLITDVKAAMSGLLDPTIREHFL